MITSEVVRFWSVLWKQGGPPGFADSLNVTLGERGQERVQGFEPKQLKEVAMHGNVENCR